jgi:predicted kinase
VSDANVDADAMVKMVLLTGPPGSGKSTMADVAASELSACVLAWDWVMAGLTRFDAVQTTFRQMEREQYRSVGWSIIWNLSVAQLRAKRSVVLDGVARDPDVTTFRDIAAEFGAGALVVSTVCSDETTHRSRVEGRIRGIPGWHELDWAHVGAVRSNWVEPEDVDLRLDAVNPLSTNEERLRSALAAL